MTKTPNNAWDRTPQTGLASKAGPFIAEVMKNDDPLFSGRLLVYIPDFGGEPKSESSWLMVRYMSPYYGVQPLSNRNAADPAGQYESYGMWMQPPDLGVKVLVMFVDGDRSRGVWMGCLPEIGSHGAIPGNDKGDFDVFENQSAANSDIKSIERPPHSTAPTFDTQGLTDDAKRGLPITTSSLRESPSKTFGFNSPGGHSFFMDDGDENGTNKMFRLRTSQGNMIMMNDDEGFVYIINAQGTGWISMSPSGAIDVYGEEGIAMATKGSIQMHADQDINLHANNNIKIVAEKQAKFQGTKEAEIYGGILKLEGAEKIHIHTCGTIYQTANKGFFFKSNAQFILEGSCFKWNSGAATAAEQVVPEAPKDVHGYKSTTERAPNHEPWPGHNEKAGSAEPSNLSAAAVIGAGSIGGAVSGAASAAAAGFGTSALGEFGNNPLDAFGGAGAAVSGDISGTPSSRLDTKGTTPPSTSSSGSPAGLSTIDVNDPNLGNGISSAIPAAIRPLARPSAIPSNNILSNGLVTLRSGGSDFNNAINTVFKGKIDLPAVKDITLKNPLTSLNGLESALNLTGESGLVGALGDAKNLLNTLQNPLGIIQNVIPNVSDALAGGAAALQNVISGGPIGALSNITNLPGAISGAIGNIGGAIGGITGNLPGIVGDLGAPLAEAASALKGIDPKNIASSLPGIPSLAKGKGTDQGANCAVGKPGDAGAPTGPGNGVGSLPGAGNQAGGGAAIPGTVVPDDPASVIVEVIEAGAGYNIVKLADGRVVRRTGSRNWRNHNPGNVEEGGFMQARGSLGGDPRFAIMPSYAAGRQAKYDLIFTTGSYKNLSISAAIARYAPAFENDTNGYARQVISAAAVPTARGGPDAIMANTNEEERQRILNAMERVEGFRPGTVEELSGTT